MQIGLEGKKGFSNQYVDPKGQFTTVTRVVSATADGKPKVLLSYMLEALSVKETRMNQPWKSSEAREKMFLMKLRVMETPRDIAAFGWATVQRALIPPDQDRDYYFQPQYVPVREFVFSARVLRDLGQEGATVQRGTTSDQGGPATIEHRHPLRNDNEGVGRSVTTSTLTGTAKCHLWRTRCHSGSTSSLQSSGIARYAQESSAFDCCHAWHAKIGYTWSAATESRKGGCVLLTVRSWIPGRGWWFQTSSVERMR